GPVPRGGCRPAWRDLGVPPFEPFRGALAEDLGHVPGRVDGVDGKRRAGAVAVGQRRREVDTGAERAGRAYVGDRIELGRDVVALDHDLLTGGQTGDAVDFHVRIAGIRRGGKLGRCRIRAEGDRVVVLEHGVGRRDVADVTAGTCPRNPWCRRVVAAVADHVEVRVGGCVRRAV